MAFLSIIIVTKHRPTKLLRALDSIKNNVSIPHEVIVTDNSKQNIGSSAGRNKGARASKGDYFLFLDDDAWIEYLPLEAMLAYLESYANVALLAPNIINPDKSLQPSIRRFPTFGALFWRGSLLYKLFPGAPWYTAYVSPLSLDSQKKTSEIDWAISACILVSKKAFDAIGGFDESYFFMHEDTDLCFRLMVKGYKRIYWPDSRVLHDYSRRSRNIFTRAFIHHIRGALKILGTIRRAKREASPPLA